MICEYITMFFAGIQSIRSRLLLNLLLSGIVLTLDVVYDQPTAADRFFNQQAVLKKNQLG